MVALLGSSAALAQEGGAKPAANPPAKVAKDKEAQSFNEIERGFYVGVSAGYWAIINPPAGQGSAQRYSGGFATQMELGFQNALRALKISFPHPGSEILMAMGTWILFIASTFIILI